LGVQLFLLELCFYFKAPVVVEEVVIILNGMTMVAAAEVLALTDMELFVLKRVMR
jgi:hypothetical protein